jgi:hypothetical protein
MTPSYLRVIFIYFFIAFGSVVAQTKKSARTLWPFDQRQIVLLKREGVEMPDPKTIAQVMDVFVRLGRVRWMTQKGQPGQILPFEVPGDFEWQSSAALRNLGLRFEADGLVVLAKRGVQVELQWFSTSDGTPLFFETLSLPQASNSDQENQRRERIQNWLHDIWSKIPGEGYVVARDMETVSIEGADQLGIKVGDVLETKRLGKVERHPLLKTLIKIDSSLTGRIEIVSMGKPFAVAKVLYESQVDPIQEGDRYLKVTNKSLNEKTSETPVTGPDIMNAVMPGGSKDLKKKDLGDGRSFIPLFGDSKGEENPTPTQPVENDSLDTTSRVDSGDPEYNIADLYFKAHYKKMKHVESTTSTATPFEMSAWAPGFEVGAKVFFTKEILLLTDFQYSFFSFKSLDDIYAVSSISSGAFQFGFGGYYRFPFLQEAGFSYRGEILAGLGFRTKNYSMAAITNDEAPTAKKYSGYELAVKIQVPILPDLAAELGASKIFFAKLTETPLTGGDDNTHQLWNVGAFLKYRWTKNSEILAGIQLESASSTFSGTATRNIASASTTWSSTAYNLGYSQRF